MTRSVVHKINPAAMGDSLMERIKSLQAQAESLSQEVFGDLLAGLSDMAEDCQNVADMPTMKPGIRELAQRLARRLEEDGMTLRALYERDT